MPGSRCLPVQDQTNLNFAERANFVVIGIAATLLLIARGPAHGQDTADDDWYLEAIRTPKDLVPKNGGNPIVIAIVDDGMRTTHQDIKNYIWENPKDKAGNRVDDDGNGFVDDARGWDVSDGDADVAPPEDRSDFYHGTHIAGIVSRMARTAYGDTASRFIRIMPVKSSADDAPNTYILDGFKGIEYAIQAGADIIIASWGVAQITPEESRILQQAADAGIFIVASGGNLPEEREQYPAAHPTVFAVASVERDGTKTVNSNYGQFIDLSAPGTGIRSAGIFSDDDYETRDGTSFSVAMVATTAAFIKLQHPSFTPREIEACLKSASVPIEVSNRDYSAKLGAGKLNAEAAVACDILAGETSEDNQLIHPQGFLRAKGKGETSIAWVIEPEGEFEGIRFTPVFNREKTPRGRIEFRANALPDAEVLASHSLDALPTSIYVPGTTAYVTFMMEKKRQRFDWLLEYEAETIDFSKLYCSGTREIKVEGTITDGSGSAPYSAHSDCKWLITAPEGKVIRIKFDEMDTEANTDLVYFFDGLGTHEKIMAIFSGGDIPPELITWGNQVLVWFVTDGQNEGRGWQANFRFQDP